ncbi:MAG: threonine synthase [Clostridiales bacterium]|nr:threonine synthase [Clostridiales bacterium]
MKYVSTRGGGAAVSGAEAIVAGLAGDRGLYVPEAFPELNIERDFDLAALNGLGYRGVAKLILSAFLPDFTEAEIEACVTGAYDSKFDVPETVRIHKADGAYFLELWHGRTAAFKDMALSILPYLLTTAVRKTGEDKKIAILTATSGDTGKAALAGFADVPGTEVFVYYPSDGVSAVQKRQMTTQEGGNVHVFGIRGNFDDAQTAVKNIFSDAAFGAELAARGVRLSSANSINIGRLLPQVVYYVYAYARLAATEEITEGDAINVCVPTGNFGNILAAYYARQIGVPIRRLLCASNENKVLTDFLRTGVYDARREFILTSSPSMDILVSSNLERLLWHTAGRDAACVRALMEGLEREGRYDLADAADPEAQAVFEEIFYGGFAKMREAHGALADLWKREGYLIDTHTAVGYAVWKDYVRETGDRTRTIIASTASPYKFAGSVSAAIGLPPVGNEFAAARSLAAHTGMPVPEGLRDLDKKPVLHDAVLEKDAIRGSVEAAL